MDTTPFEMTGDWHAAGEALLDEHHVVAVSDDEATRIHFGTHVAIQAEQMTDVEVCPIYGRFVRNLDDLVYTLSRAMPAMQPVEPTIEGVIDTCRRHRRGTKRRYIIWHGADTLAREQPQLFHQAADAMMGVAAEQEYASEDLLVITRCLFIGPPALAEQPAFRNWWAEGDEPPLWQVISGIDQPPVLRVDLKSTRPPSR